MWNITFSRRIQNIFQIEISLKIIHYFKLSLELKSKDWSSSPFIIKTFLKSLITYFQVYNKLQKVFENKFETFFL